MLAVSAASGGMINAAAVVPQPTSGTAPNAAAAASSASSLGVTASPDGWLTYTNLHGNSLPITGVTATTVAGKRGADGQCEITGGSSASSPGPAAAGSVAFTEQTAFNPKTCRAKFRTGQIPRAVADQLQSGSPAAATMLPDTSAASQPAKLGTSAPAQFAEALAVPTAFQRAYTIARWIDPINVVITSQTVNFRWPLHGAIGPLSASSPSYKFPLDGWIHPAPAFSGVVGLAGGTGWYVEARRSHFINTDFAAGVMVLLGISGWLACGAHLTTRADFFHTVRVTGNKSGTRANTWSNSVSGACSNLVHVEAWGAYGSHT